MSLSSWIFNFPFTAQDHLKMTSVCQGGEMIEIHINHKQCVVFGQLPTANHNMNNRAWGRTAQLVAH